MAGGARVAIFAQALICLAIAIVILTVADLDRRRRRAAIHLARDTALGLATASAKFVADLTGLGGHDHLIGLAVAVIVLAIAGLSGRHRRAAGAQAGGAAGARARADAVEVLVRAVGAGCELASQAAAGADPVGRQTLVDDPAVGRIGGGLAGGAGGAGIGRRGVAGDAAEAAQGAEGNAEIARGARVVARSGGGAGHAGEGRRWQTNVAGIGRTLADLGASPPVLAAVDAELGADFARRTLDAEARVAVAIVHARAGKLTLRHSAVDRLAGAIANPGVAHGQVWRLPVDELGCIGGWRAHIAAKLHAATQAIGLSCVGHGRAVAAGQQPHWQAEQANGCKSQRPERGGAPVADRRPIVAAIRHHDAPSNSAAG